MFLLLWLIVPVFGASLLMGAVSICSVGGVGGLEAFERWIGWRVVLCYVGCLRAFVLLSCVMRVCCGVCCLLFGCVAGRCVRLLSVCDLDGGVGFDICVSLSCVLLV